MSAELSSNVSFDDVDWSRSDKWIRTEVGPRISIGPSTPTLGEIFPNLRPLRDSLAVKQGDLTAYFEESIRLMLIGHILSDFMTTLVSAHPEEFDQSLKDFFVK